MSSWQAKTLCWDCARLCIDQCCWMAEGKPVPDWTATRRDIDTEESYIVHECPEFTRDKDVKEYRDPKELDTNGCISLLEKVVKTCRSDYLRFPRMRAEIRWFLEGKDQMLRILDQDLAEQEKAERLKRRMRPA